MASDGGPAVLVGIDLVPVADVAAAIHAQGARYLERLFTPSERATVEGAAPEVVATRLAARFAAKEAAMKAFGLTDGFDHRSIEVRLAASGRPELAFYGAAAQHVANLGLASHSVSLSHDADYAVAVVVGLAVG